MTHIFRIPHKISISLRQENVTTVKYESKLKTARGREEEEMAGLHWRFQFASLSHCKASFIDVTCTIYTNVSFYSFIYDFIIYILNFDAGTRYFIVIYYFKIKVRVPTIINVVLPCFANLTLAWSYIISCSSHYVLPTYVISSLLSHSVHFLPIISISTLKYIISDANSYNFAILPVLTTHTRKCVRMSNSIARTYS